MSEQITVRQVADKATEAMIAMGQRPNSVWSGFYPNCRRIVSYYDGRGLEYYDPIVTAGFISETNTRFENGECCLGTRNNYRRTAERMNEVFLTGRIQWSCKSAYIRKPLSHYFSALHAEYLQSNEFHPNTREDISWAVHKHLLWLMRNGHTNLSTVTERDIGGYIGHCAGKVCPGSLRNLICYTRKFYGFLEAKGETGIGYNGFLSIRVCRPEKIQAAATHDEVEAVLAQINRVTPIGRRDYAAILLGARMGLRAADIICLKLRDINWKENQISITQQKTGESLLLPMPTDVCEALKEYILLARPKSEHDQIFLRSNAPFQPLAAGSALGYIYRKYQQMAGIERRPFDGRGFHGLRRMLGKEMTIAGVPVTTIAQVLGHRSLNTAKQYISLDTAHLKECALDFRGIELTGGVF